VTPGKSLSYVRMSFARVAVRTAGVRLDPDGTADSAEGGLAAQRDGAQAGVMAESGERAAWHFRKISFTKRGGG